MTVRDRDLAPNNNDGAYPGIGSRAVKNLVDADQDGFYALDGVLRFTFPDGPTQTIQWTPDIQGKVQILAVQVIKTGAAGSPGDTVQVLSDVVAGVGNPISEAISLNAPNKQVLYGAQIDVAQNTADLNDPIFVTRTKVSNGNAACVVLINVARSL